MILADGGVPGLWLILATVLGGSVVAGGANAMNMYFDRDIDEIMLRTQERPIPSHQVEPERAAIFGFLLGAPSGKNIEPSGCTCGTTGLPSIACTRLYPRDVA